LRFESGTYTCGSRVVLALRTLKTGGEGDCS
jgi:hypothetical protein